MSDNLDTLLTRAEEHRKFNRLRYFLKEQEIYWYQKAFIEATKSYFVCMSFAGNQTGKTTVDAIIAAMFSTGEYDLFPGGWEGRRFDRPTLGYILGPTTDSVRDNLQYQLLGPMGEHGTGFIPKDCIEDIKYRHSSAGAVDTIKVKWKGRSGKTGSSEIRLKSSDMDVKALAGPTVDWVANEEHSNVSIWNELQYRLIARGGIIFGSCTPVTTKSASDNEWLRYIRQKADDPKARMFFITFSQHEAKHLTPAMIETLAANCQDEEMRKARVDGLLNMYGAGLVFPMNEAEILVNPGVDAPLEIPGHWRRVCGIDFGTTDGTALIWMAEDPQTGALYVYDEDYMTTATGYSGGFMFHVAQAVFRRGKDIPVVWPHDGNRHAEGQTLAEGYRNLGMKMTIEPINRFDASQAGGLVKMLTAIQSGRLKVYPRCRRWLDERRSYMWADDGRGAKAKQTDHHMDASRYAFMGIEKEGRTMTDFPYGAQAGYSGPETYGPSDAWEQ